MCARKWQFRKRLAGMIPAGTCGHIDAMRDLELLIEDLPGEESVTQVSTKSEDGRKEILQKTRQAAININPNSASALKISNNLDTLESALAAIQPTPPVIDGNREIRLLANSLRIPMNRLIPKSQVFI